MKKLLILLSITVFTLVGCGTTDYSDPQIYIDAIKDEANSQSDYLELANEYLDLVGASDNAGELVASYTNLIGAALVYYPNDQEELYNQFVLDIKDIDFKELEEELAESIESYNSKADTLKSAESKLVNSSLKVMVTIINGMTTVVESDQFNNIVENTDSIIEALKDIDADELDIQ